MIFIFYLILLTVFFAVSIFTGLVLVRFAARVVQDAIARLFTGDDSPVFTWLTFTLVIVIMLIMIVAPPVVTAVIIANQPATPTMTPAPIVIFIPAPTPTVIPESTRATAPVSVKPRKCKPVLFGNLFCVEDQ